MAKESRFIIEHGYYEDIIEQATMNMPSALILQLELAIKSASIEFVNSHINADQMSIEQEATLNECHRFIMSDNVNIVEQILTNALNLMGIGLLNLGENPNRNARFNGRVGDALFWSCWGFSIRCLRAICSDLNEGEEFLNKSSTRSRNLRRKRKSTERYLMERWDKLGRAQQAVQQRRFESIDRLAVCDSELPYRLKSPFTSTQFRRLVVDEGHQLGEAAMFASFRLMCHLVIAKNRWIMTGTPLSPNPDTAAAQLQRLLEFIHHPSAFRFPNSSVSLFSRLLRRSGDAIDSNDSSCTSHNDLAPTIPTSSTSIIAPSKLGLGSLSASFFLHCLLNETLVIHSKSQLSQLPPLYGPTLYRLVPTVQERNSYNDLVELAQRNLFLAYFSRRNIASLLHPSNRSLATETLMNLHLACLCNATSHFHVRDEDALESMEMLVKSKEEESHNGQYNHCYYPHDEKRLKFVHQVPTYNHHFDIDLKHLKK